MVRKLDDMKTLGFLGIFAESFRVISSTQKLFTKITLALILPLAFVFMFHIVVSDLFFGHIYHSHERRTYPDRSRSGRFGIESEVWALYWLFRAAYYVVLLVFSLLSTSAVVYAVACVYTASDVTFKKVMNVVPKVWKRLMVTFLWAFIAFFAFNCIASVLYYTWTRTIGFNSVGTAIAIILFILYVVGFIYLSIVWQVATVISVLEEMYGLKAVVKSKELVKGKMVAIVVIFFLLNAFVVGIQFIFEIFVAYPMMDMMFRMVIGMACLLVLMMLFLFGMVIQTVIYFVCKSHHGENIDTTALYTHLDVIYLGKPIPPKSQDAQLAEFNV